MPSPNFSTESSRLLSLLKGTNPFRAPGDETPAQDRLERVTALAVTFLSDKELDVLARRTELALAAAFQRGTWKQAGNPESRAELLDVMETLTRASSRS